MTPEKDTNHSVYPKWLCEELARELGEWVESYALNGSETFASFSSDTDSTEEEGVTITRVFCGDEVASKMRLLPPETRARLDRYWRKELVECVGEFIRNWNSDHDNKLPVLEDSPDAYDKIPLFEEYGDEVLDAETEWRTDWFSDYACVFEVRARQGEGKSLEIEVAFNMAGPVFPGTSDSIVYKCGFYENELQDKLNSYKSLSEGFERLAENIVSECMNKYDEEASLEPSM